MLLIAVFSLLASVGWFLCYYGSAIIEKTDDRLDADEKKEKK
jgi:hypothetical protein